MANPQNVERKWYVIDAEGMVMGRKFNEELGVPLFAPRQA